MNKLFAVMLGGRNSGCNTELHDVVFIIADKLENVYPKLADKWFGDIPDRLHIDAYIEIDVVDGYKINFTHTPNSTEQNKLFFINCGGYKEGIFGEFHEVGFYVTDSVDTAKSRARAELCQGQLKPHADDKLEVQPLINKSPTSVDDCIELNKVDDMYVSLEPTNQANLQTIYTAVYVELNTKEILAKTRRFS